MAEEIDEILAELDDGTISPETNPKKTLRSNSYMAISNDLSSILNDLKDADDDQKRHQRSSSFKENNKTIKKCSAPMVGGPEFNESSSIKICNKLRCLSCDSPVITIDGFQWAEDTEYIFLRNNYPDVSKLHKRLIPSRLFRSYCCQCSNISVNNLAHMGNWNELKWICSGHY